MGKHKQPDRDDDPVHPNLHGIRFQATTDRTGVVAVPTSADTMPPVSFIGLDEAVDILGNVQGLIAAIRKTDPANYFAEYLDGAAEDLSDAIRFCREAKP